MIALDLFVGEIAALKSVELQGEGEASDAQETEKRNEMKRTVSGVILIKPSSFTLKQGKALPFDSCSRKPAIGLPASGDMQALTAGPRSIEAVPRFPLPPK